MIVLLIALMMQLPPSDFQRGITALEAEAPETALAIADENILAHPRDSRFHRLRGQAFIALIPTKGQQANIQAITSLTQAVELDHHYGDAFGRLSGALYNANRLDEAISAAESGVKWSHTGREKALALCNKGLTLDRLNRKKEAIEVFSLAAQWDPSYARAYYGKGKVMSSLRMWKQAESELRKAIELEPKNGFFWTQLAYVLRVSRRTEEELEAAKLAVLFNPGLVLGHYELCFAYGRSREYEWMLQEADFLVNNEPELLHIHALRAEALQGLNRFEESAKELALDPDYKAPSVLGQYLTAACDSSSTIAIPGRPVSSDVGCSDNFSFATSPDVEEKSARQRELLGPPSKRPAKGTPRGQRRP